MLAAAQGRIALLSHILPPSPAGQAGILHRILSSWPTQSYRLLSRVDYNAPIADGSGAPRLPGRHEFLEPSRPSRWLSRIPSDSAVFVLETLRGISRRAGQVAAVLRSEPIDALVACSGDLIDLPAALLACSRTGVPLIPWMFDDYMHQWTGIGGTLARCFGPPIVRRAAAVIVPNAAARDAYRIRYGITPVVVCNPCELPDLAALDALPSPFSPQETTVVYTGSIYHAQFDAFRNLVEVLDQIGYPGLKLHVYTSQTAEDLARGGVGGPRIVRHAHIPPSEIPAILRKADVLFLPLSFRSAIPEVIRTSAPGKMGEYLASGRPVLVHAPVDAFVSRYFRENRCGVVVDVDDAAVLADALRRLLGGKGREQLGTAARAAAERDFSLAGARTAFLGMLESVEALRHVDR